MANMLASVAAFETEIRGERVRAGQQAAKEAGKTWGGSKKGRRIKTTQDQVSAIVKMKAEGVRIATIARTVSLTRLTVYRILEQEQAGVA